jgi:hypothetical protein
MRTSYRVVQESSDSLSGREEGVATREGGTWDGLGGCIGCLLLFGLVACRRGRVAQHIITIRHHPTLTCPSPLLDCTHPPRLVFVIGVSFCFCFLIVELAFLSALRFEPAMGGSFSDSSS